MKQQLDYLAEGLTEGATNSRASWWVIQFPASYRKLTSLKDNEYSQSGFGRAEYFQELEDTYRANGIVVPLTYNDPGQRMNFINGTVRRGIHRSSGH